LIDLLWNIAYDNGECPTAKKQLAYAARRLLGYSELEEEDVIKYLPLYVSKDGFDASDVYDYSISWKKPIVQSWLEENCTSGTIKTYIIMYVFKVSVTKSI